MRSVFVGLLLVCLIPLPALADSWLVVSDIHLNPDDTSAVPSGYGADANWALWRSTLAQMHAVQPHPAVIVVAGDVLAHHFPHDEAKAEATMERIERSLAQTFPRAQILMTLGNNDDPCGDYRARADGAYMAALSSIWHEPLANGGHYTAPLPHRERAIVLDDVFWSVFYHPCDATRAAEHAELRWLSDVLAATPASQRLVLVDHIPPGIDASGTLIAHRFLVMRYLRSSDEQPFETTLQRYASHIAFAITGHTHRADFRILDGVPTVIAPSVSPIYDNNPAFLTLAVGTDGSLKDYAIYADDIATGAWSELFDFDRAYGASRVDARSMLAAHATIERDPSVRAQWETTLVTGSPHAEVNDSTWRTAWCAQTTQGRAFDTCAHLRRRLLVLPIVGGLLAVIVLASIATIVLNFGVRWKSNGKGA